MSSKQWTTRELADEAGRRGRPVSQEHLRQLCAEGELRAEKPGRDWLIPDWAAQRWLNDWLSR
jgi:excisionase family DNA binding protein